MKRRKRLLCNLSISFCMPLALRRDGSMLAIWSNFIRRYDRALHDETFRQVCKSECHESWWSKVRFTSYELKLGTAKHLSGTYALEQQARGNSKEEDHVESMCRRKECGMMYSYETELTKPPQTPKRGVHILIRQFLLQPDINVESRVSLYSSSDSSSSDSAFSSHSRNFSALLRTLREVCKSTYFLLALPHQALRLSSETRSFS